jgi:hypothetical protein
MSMTSPIIIQDEFKYCGRCGIDIPVQYFACESCFQFLRARYVFKWRYCCSCGKEFKCRGISIPTCFQCIREQSSKKREQIEQMYILLQQNKEQSQGSPINQSIQVDLTQDDDSEETSLSLCEQMLQQIQQEIRQENTIVIE